MRRHVYPDHADQSETNRQFARAINDLADESSYTGVITVSSDTELSVQFGLYLVDATSGAIAITVPPPEPHKDKRWTVKKADAGGFTVTLSSTANIDGSGTHVLNNQYDSVTIISDGSEWFITAKV